MIKVERSRVPPPPHFRARADVAAKELADFFEQDFSARIQRTPRFDSTIWKDVRLALRELFFNKCSYCESPLGGAMIGDVDHFRPKAGAIGLERTDTWPDHYWWLAYEWSNLYLTCQLCGFNKGSRFPLLGPRADVGAKGDQLLAEQPLLLDPCHDDPTGHLAFGDEGTVTPLSERGRLTIELLQLDREGLVRERRMAVEEVKLRLALALGAGTWSKQWEELLSPHYPYAAARRQAIHRFMRGHAGEVEDALDASQAAQLWATMETASPFISAEDESVGNQVYVASRHETEIGATSEAERRKFFFGKTQYITRVEITNFRVIEQLDLRFPEPADGSKPWIVMLGENGMGKSTILKAVSLALMGTDTRRALRLRPGTFLRHGADEGFVRVHVAGFTAPFELRLRRGAADFESNGLRLQTLLFGYGSTRLPSRRRRSRRPGDEPVYVENLFNPFLPLTNPRAWLLALEEEPFGFSARAMKLLLMQDEETILVRMPHRRPRRVELLTGAARRGPTLHELSDGYQSVVALASDLMQAMLAYWDSVEDAEGIVIIDEIDVHLHPRWKIEIVSLLRRVFPRVQFLVTTHDSLCLMGTRPGEVQVLRVQPATGRVVANQVDVPPGASADQLLTGFWFGLPSTTDPDTQRLLAEYRGLLRAGTPIHDERRRRLEAELRARFLSVTDTSVDRVAQSVASEVIQEDYRELAPEQREAVRMKILRLVRNRLDGTRPKDTPRPRGE